MFLILSVKSAAELVISVQDMRNINKPDKGDHTGKCELKKKKKLKLSPWKWKERILNFLSELYLVCIFECICHAFYTQRTNVNQVGFFFFQIKARNKQKRRHKQLIFFFITV